MRDDQETKVQRCMRWIANHPVYSVVMVVGLAVIGIGAFTNALRDIWELVPTVERPPKIQAECHMGLMPVVVPSEGRIYVLSLFPTPIENGGGGLIEYFAQPGSEWKWPSSDGAPMTGYRCHVSNYGDAPVFNFEMALGSRFTEAVRDQSAGTTRSGAAFLSRDWPVAIAKINAGEADPFVFYVVNTSEHFVDVTLPDNAALELDGPDAKQTLPLIKPADSRMFFAPVF